MINIKNFMIIIISALLSINVASGLPTCKNHNARVKVNIFMYEKKNMLYNFQNNKIQYYDYNNVLKFMVFGMHRNPHFISYCTIGYDVQNGTFKLKHPIDIFNHINPMCIGIHVHKLGNIEYGKKYNFTYDVNCFTRKKFDIDCGLQALHIIHDITYHVKNLISYYNKNFFGLIDHLTIASQYQYLDSSLPVDLSHDKLNHFIRYDFNGDKGSIAGAYSVNINHYFNQDFLNFFKDKTKSYSVGLKYIFKKLYFAVFYSIQENFSKQITQKYFFDRTKDIELLSEYNFTPHIIASIKLIRMYVIHNIYQEKCMVLQNYDLLSKDKSFDIFNTCNTAVKYRYNKNTILYLQNNFEIENSNTVSFAVNNVLEGGMTLTF
ncbi:porin [Buchnera aphidicola (Takecallis taiwana)]|uniref:porin n=1 Tax=Buchnera aphidicola TaxID=9 RepID=UPI0031B6C776